MRGTYLILDRDAKAIARVANPSKAIKGQTWRHFLYKTPDSEGFTGAALLVLMSEWKTWRYWSRQSDVDWKALPEWEVFA